MQFTYAAVAANISIFLALVNTASMIVKIPEKPVIIPSLAKIFVTKCVNPLEWASRRCAISWKSLHLETSFGEG